MRLRPALSVLLLCSLVVSFTPIFSEDASAQGGWECGAYDQTAERGRVPAADGAGRVFPVVTIHGITGTDGDFDKVINKSYIGANPQPPRSLLDAFAGSKTGEALPPGLEGVRVYSFSYTPDSLRWIDNPAVGGKFAATIDCLYAKFGVPVSVVAHSMGGLVTRWVANTNDNAGVSRATKLGKVITLGTPYEGSVMSAVANGVTDVAGASSWWVALLNMLCGEAGTATGRDRCPLYSSPRSEAGRNLRAGSEAIRGLTRWPSGVDVATLAGSERVPLSLFGSTLRGTIDIGDVAVTTDSATADPSAGRVFECRYDTPASTGLTILKEIVGIADPIERRAKLTGAFLASPCYHSNLMSNVEVTNEVLGLLSDWLTANRVSKQPATTKSPPTIVSPTPTTAVPPRTEDCPPLSSGSWTGTWTSDTAVGSGSVVTEVFVEGDEITGDLELTDSGLVGGQISGDVQCEIVTFGRVDNSIEFEGTLSADGGTLEGMYWAYVDGSRPLDTGSFAVSRAR